MVIIEEQPLCCSGHSELDFAIDADRRTPLPQAPYQDSIHQGLLDLADS